MFTCKELQKAFSISERKDQ